MTLVGTLKSGARVEQLPLCEFEFDGVPANTSHEWDCGETATFRVVYEDGTMLYACEEHIEELWERDEAPSAEVSTD